MGILIDTNILIDAENDRFDLGRLRHYAGHGNTFISVITVTELLMGVHLATSAAARVRRSAFVEGMISKITVLNFNEEIARVYAELYSHQIQSRRKTEGNLHDLQIAATAITYDHLLLTNNIADFKKTPGLRFEKP